MKASALEGNDHVKFDVQYGRIELASRLLPLGGKLIGECRAWHYDRKGKLVIDTGWQATGAEMSWPQP